MIKVLLVDDDRDLLDVMTYSLRRDGFDVVSAMNGLQAIERWQAEIPAIVVVDLELEKMNGLDVCRRIRRESTVPIMLLTSTGDEDQLVRGVQLGADDYMLKPMSMKLFAARLRALLRRCNSNPYEYAVGEVQAGDLVLNLEAHEARNKKGVVQLTPLEFRILYLLAMNEGRVIPYSRLVDYAWGLEGGDSFVLKSHICHIRKKLGLPDDGPGSIKSLIGVGYSLVKSRPAMAEPTPEVRPARHRPPLRRRLATRGQPPVSVGCSAPRRLPAAQPVAV